MKLIQVSTDAQLLLVVERIQPSYWLEFSHYTVLSVQHIDKQNFLKISGGTLPINIFFTRIVQRLKSVYIEKWCENLVELQGDHITSYNKV